MVAEADRRFAGRAGIKPLEVRGLKLWLVGSDAVIRFKKMDASGRSRSYQTEQQRDYDANREIPGLPPPATRLVVGYLLDTPQTKIERVQVARPLKNGRTAWCAAIVPETDRQAGQARWFDVTRQVLIA